jgi:cytidine deaminase
MTLPNHNELVRRARAARRNSHSPYSGFRVGAALLASNGKIYTGCNVEISTYALTLCAERTAAFKARSEGVKSFRAIAIATDAQELISPCGACRQVLMDLCGDIDVILAGPRGACSVFRLSDLLPMAFGPGNLSRHKKP